MRENNMLKKFLTRLKLAKRPAQPQAAVKPDTTLVSKLLQMVEGTQEVELSCDETFALLDQYVEYEARGEDVSKLFPLVKDHLDRCRDCHEEYEALARVFEASTLHNNP
jgi:hypothetical protein